MQTGIDANAMVFMFRNFFDGLIYRVINACIPVKPVLGNYNVINNNIIFRYYIYIFIIYFICHNEYLHYISTRVLTQKI